MAPQLLWILYFFKILSNCKFNQCKSLQGLLRTPALCRSARKQERRTTIHSCSLQWSIWRLAQQGQDPSFQPKECAQAHRFRHGRRLLLRVPRWLRGHQREEELGSHCRYVSFTYPFFLMRHKDLQGQAGVNISTKILSYSVTDFEIEKLFRKRESIFAIFSVLFTFTLLYF